MRPSGIGGQAVIEGVMMKNKDMYAVAVRKSNNEIVVDKQVYESASAKHPILKLPIVRGVVAFIESMVLGMKTLTFAASFFEEEDEKPTKIETAFNNVFKEKAESIFMGLTVILSLIMAIGIFMFLPFFIAGLLEKQIASPAVLAVIEGVLRITIFIVYVAAISQMKDIKRVFMYHGAEHKTINCLENGFELTVENVKWQSKEHKRCGTSFMLIVMVVSIIFFIFIRVDEFWLRMVLRLLLIPVIAGISYEFIRLAGHSDFALVNILSRPGMWLQGLTTREPDEDMIEVAIQSVEAVFDWKEYLKEEGSQEDLIKGALLKEKAASIKDADLAEEEFSSTLSDVEEEDEILRALDKYFVAENDTEPGAAKRNASAAENRNRPKRRIKIKKKL